MQLNKIVPPLNYAVAVSLGLGGLAQIFGKGFIKGVIIGAYLELFAALIVFLEWAQNDVVDEYLAIMHSLLGRGVLYLFLGYVTFNDSLLTSLFGWVICLVAVFMIAVEFTSFERPANMSRNIWNASEERISREELV